MIREPELILNQYKSRAENVRLCFLVSSGPYPVYADIILLRIHTSFTSEAPSFMASE